jgi:hypothetical protein
MENNKQSLFHVEYASIRNYPPNVAAQVGEYQKGDFILTHGNTFFSILIRIGQSLAFWGEDSKYTWWNHSALIVSKDGNIIEALGSSGVKLNHISKYAPTDFHIVSLGELASERDREQMCTFAYKTLDLKYGLMIIISIAIGLITGCRFKFGFDGEYICSGLVARALERTSVIFDRSPSHIMPADLAKYFLVEPPQKGQPKGDIPQ